MLRRLGRLAPLAVLATLTVMVSCGAGDVVVPAPGEAVPRTLARAPTETPTPVPTAAPKKMPTAAPTPVPTAAPTPVPTAAPRPVITSTPPPSPLPVITSPPTDREILVALYWATDGENWLVNTNWLSDAPIGEWHGITADQYGHVIELHLIRNELSGEIPPGLGNLVNLERLDLSLNNLSGDIPPESGNLVNLMRLDLSYNQLHGEILPESGNLVNLRRLDLSYNQLHGEIPPELGNLVKLAELDLFDNQLQGGIPAELGNLVNLELLDLSDNNLSGDIPLELGNLTNLRDLLLYDNRLSGEIPPELGNLVNLTQLSFDSNQLRGEIPPWLGDLTDLEYVSLENNELSGEIPPQLGNLTDLVFLDLARNNLSGEIPPEFSSITGLLLLSGNNLSGCILDNLTYKFDLPRDDPSVLFFCSEREALVALYGATNGNHWRSNSNWLSDAPPDKWHGVISGSWHSRVIELDLSDNGLIGWIPPQLSNLTWLEALRLGGNSLNGCIPDGLYGELNLNRSDLGNLSFCGQQEALVALYWATDGDNWRENTNWLSGASIGEWYGVTTDDANRVTQLDLSENGLSGWIPDQLGSLTALNSLYLDGNHLDGCLHYNWRSHLDLANSDFGDLSFCGRREALVALYNATDGDNWHENTNCMSDAPIGEWYGVTTDHVGNVTSIGLSENGLNGELPPELGDLANMFALGLTANGLRGEIPPELGNITDLWILDLSFNQLSGEIPSELGNIIDLWMLDLSLNQLSGEIPSELGNLANLEILTVFENQLKGCVPAGLQGQLRHGLDHPGDLPFCP